MDLGLPPWVGDVGPVAGLLIVLFVALVRGWLVPGRTVDRLLDEKQRMIDMQSQAVVRLETACDIQRNRAEAAENREATLLTGLDTQTQVLRSIQAAAARRRLD